MSELTGLVLFVREGCHLCEDFLLNLSLDFGLDHEDVAVVDVSSDVALALRYGLRVPVLTRNGEPIAEGIFDSAQIRHALRL